MIEKWKINSKKRVFESKWISVIENCAIMPNGTLVSNYYSIENQDAVMVAAIDDETNIVLKKEYRLPIDKVLLELPAGAIESGDLDCLAAAKRELFEETGYVSENWFYVGETYDCPDRCTAKLHLFIALGANKKATQHLDKTENIEFVTVPLKEVEEMCLSTAFPVNSCARLVMMAGKFLLNAE